MVKASHTHYRALDPELIPGVQAVSPQLSHPPGGRLPLLSATPTVTFQVWTTCPRLSRSFAL